VCCSCVRSDDSSSSSSSSNDSVEVARHRPRVGYQKDARFARPQDNMFHAESSSCSRPKTSKSSCSRGSAAPR
jgi:hypothetical protein